MKEHLASVRYCHKLTDILLEEFKTSEEATSNTALDYLSRNIVLPSTRDGYLLHCGTPRTVAIGTLSWLWTRNHHEYEEYGRSVAQIGRTGRFIDNSIVISSDEKYRLSPKQTYSETREL